VDYNHNLEEVEIPSDADKQGYEVAQRRADMYRRAREGGGLNQLPSYRVLADEYDVSTSMISKDMKRIRAYIVDNDLNSEKLKATFADTMQWALEEAQEEGDYSAVPRIVKEYKSLAQDTGVIEKSADKMEVEHSGGVADKLAEIYADESGD